MKIRKEFLQKAKKQFCQDFYCKLDEFERNGNVITPYGETISRQYALEKPVFRMLCFYDKILITAAEGELFDWAKKEFQSKYSGWVFSYPSLKQIDRVLEKYGQEIKDMHHYYLPLENFKKAEDKFTLKWFDERDIEAFRSDNKFSEAFAFHPRYKDVIGVAALKGDEIMGMAGASVDGEDLWQIGINVLPEFRVNGLAANLVTHLKDEIIRRGKVPFYGTVESNNLSKSVAIKSGFFPVWSEIYSGPIKKENI